MGIYRYNTIYAREGRLFFPGRRKSTEKQGPGSWRSGTKKTSSEYSSGPVFVLYLVFVVLLSCGLVLVQRFQARSAATMTAATAMISRASTLIKISMLPGVLLCLVFPGVSASASGCEDQQQDRGGGDTV